MTSFSITNGDECTRCNNLGMPCFADGELLNNYSLWHKFKVEKLTCPVGLAYPEGRYAGESIVRARRAQKPGKGTS